jgi:hypothetical protein
MEKENYKDYYFQDNNEKLIFKILANTLKNNLDQILEANQVCVSNENKNYALFSAMLHSKDPTSLDNLFSNEVSSAFFS